MVGTSEDRSEIAFFDLETTVPTRSGQGFAILEFGAILVCPRKLVELQSFSTLVRPADLAHISTLSVRCNGITKEAVISAPGFMDIADTVYDLLHGRIWAGHNILRFDCARIKEAFAEINRPAPEPKGIIDSLAILTQKFGRRAGDMKMATLATYFGIGQQTHRSLDDVRMNLEVLKYCATVLFLESSLPDIFTENSWVSPNVTTRSRSNGKTSVEQASQNVNTPSSSVKAEIHSTSPTSDDMEEVHPILSLVMPNTDDVTGDLIESIPARSDPFNMVVLSDEMVKYPLPKENMEDEKSLSTQESSTASASGDSNGCTDFLEADNISIPSLSVTFVPFYRGSQKIQVLHKNFPLQVLCRHLKVRFGISTKFVDHTGRPRLSFVVNAPPSLCQVLDASDDLAKKLSMDSGSYSEWRSVVIRKPGFYNYPTVRLHLPTVADGDGVHCITEIYKKDSSATQRLVFSRFDIVELESLFNPGNLVDAYFSLDTYDYQQNAGIRAVAKKLIICTN
ncbi:protein NEN1-like [Olea europaea var. sylvestris]|uniref:protein NEN1-like n=1 Tax=Olea europaea var. sylvestris TaxID=158386 RepID=UPI000C1D720C|nr:protein NEN1-like [Olea europaea var. sylvestris]